MELVFGMFEVFMINGDVVVSRRFLLFEVVVKFRLLESFILLVKVSSESVLFRC